MTDFTSVPLLTTGDWIDAAWGNTYWRDNFAALFPYTTAGDLAYAASSSALSRLGIGGAGALMYSTGTAPAWKSLGTAYQTLRVNAAANGIEWAGGGIVVASHSDSSGSSYSTASWRDIPSSSNTITPLVTSTIIVYGVINNYGTGTYGERQFMFNIGGTDISTMVSHESYQINERVVTPVIGIKTGVTLGGKTIKMREYSNAAGHTISSLFWVAAALPE